MLRNTKAEMDLSLLSPHSAGVMFSKATFEIISIANVQLSIFETLKNVNVEHTLIILHRSLYPSFRFSFADISAAIVLLFALTDSEFELHESPLTIQAKRDQSQAFGPGFSDE